MASIQKLSTFRQLSLNCDSPTLDQRRKSLKKQFSEDFCDVKEKFGSKTRDRPHPIRIAWAESPSPKEEGVIAKKCIKEVKKNPKLTRRCSLEKDSILYSKQELAERLRQVLKDREQEKPNLNIFLAHNTYAEEDHEPQEPEVITKDAPKIIPPLIAPTENIKNVFQIKKNKDMSYISTKSSAVVVIPVVDKEPPQILQDVTTPPPSDRSDKQDSKAIKNVIIRPATAAAKRERFQKRNNSAFNSIIKEGGVRPPLMRSSSAPSKPEQAKPKFLATKRKIKSGKARTVKATSDDEDSVSNKENPKNKKETNRHIAINGTDVVTMVSLISPAASDTEEIEIDVEVEPKPKIKTSPQKIAIVKKEEKDTSKNVSLRKTVKSVSFQSSSIHAIRSFSASFPGRRGSMATALMLGNALKNQKSQEKRTTNSTPTNDDERGPKRRLVKITNDKTQKSGETGGTPKTEDDETKITDANITIDMKAKIVEEEKDKPSETTNTTDVPANLITDESKEETKDILDDGQPKFGSIKEKECWDMYCKMVDRGLKVSYDTILRGMLTPTEYRMRRKESITPLNEETNTQ